MNKIWITVFCVLSWYNSMGQQLSALQKKVSVHARQVPLVEILDTLSAQTGIAFSYHSALVPENKKVNLSVSNTSLSEVLKKILPPSIALKESGRYIIFQSENDESHWTISGVIVDEQTNEQISGATVYDPERLVYANTDDQGAFRLTLKAKQPTDAIMVNRMAYAGVKVKVRSGHNQKIIIKLKPAALQLDTLLITGNSRQNTLLYHRWFLSSKQRLQSINLNNVFIQSPVQLSVVPGVGTHGKMSTQVYHHASLNLLGGYTGGTRGIEVGGLFNINKGSSSGLQAAGLFNLVGDSINGVQLAGVYNQVSNQVTGVQAAGVANRTTKDVVGVQLSGVANLAQNLDGWQAAGIVNVAREDVTGVQVAGIINIAKKLSGLQVGLINMADSSTGVSIGLVNIVRSGYHKISLSNTELMHAQINIKSGTPQLYNIYFAGKNFSKSNQSSTFGLGLGCAFDLDNTLTLNPEISNQYLYLGEWHSFNSLSRFQLILHWQPNRLFGFYGGPSFNAYYSNQVQFDAGYAQPVPALGTFPLNNRYTGWLGWNVGISFF